MRIITRICNGIDKTSQVVGRAASFLIAVIIISVAYDVFARYMFNNPTSWSYVLSYILGSSVIALGAAYVHLHNANVRIDLLYDRLSQKGKHVLDAIFTVLFFFPYIGVINYIFIQDALYSVRIREVSHETIWYAPLYPFKIILAIGVILLLIQGVANFIRDVTFLKTGERLQ